MYVKQAHCVSNDLDALLRNRNLAADPFSSFDDFFNNDAVCVDAAALRVLMKQPDLL